MDVAHRAAEKKEWARAADYYARAGSTPETTWLHGWALQQDGKDAQGREMMRRAETLTLGDERLMTALAAAMESHGHAKDAELQRRRLERVGTPRTWFYYNNCLFLGKTLADQNDSAGAAEYWQIYILSTLESAGPISNEIAFIRTPGLIHLHRGRGLIQQGRVEEAMREYRLTLEDAPGRAQPTVDLVPELRKLGHEAAARQLFDLSYAKLQVFCAKYARSAYFHNEMAWLCTRCGYEADAALAHAQRAVELRPRSTACLDTLAEVHFHRGERAKAVALMQQCEALQPREPRHRKRREEFEKGLVN
jgi:tetratricopeptide (TPR) repeat protein